MGKVLGRQHSTGLSCGSRGWSPALTLAQFWPGSLLSKPLLYQFLTGTWEQQEQAVELGLDTSVS